MAGKIAIVGAGPSGCYVAQAFLKADPGLEVDLIDALPVPFGLVRYGVAADHQGTKGVMRQFARIFERQGARFFGNVHIGRDVTLKALREAYDAVVLAAGLCEDRRLSIPGGDLPGVHGAAALTRALHEHPQAGALPALGPHPLILGNGNVAIDLLRLLCKTSEELNGTDLGPGPSAWLAGNAFEAITIVGRSPAARAKFDPVMIRELGKLGNVSIKVEGAGRSEEPEEQKRLEALAAIDGHGSGPLKVTFRFELRPLSVEGKDRVAGLRVEGPNGEETVRASSVLTAIGFDSNGDLDRATLLDEAGEREAGKLADGLFAAGWFRRGPRGTIPDSRTEAQATAAAILEEMAPDPARAGPAIFHKLENVVDYAGWQRIDAAELARSTPERCRQKLPSTGELLRAATQQDIDQ
ncbi:FAD-dependent oxidoreductase [Mesorhizobium xinjiangense]|uniref:FAD-dependent oxidoreductase n=1 Tax=Mesorhizobium xinjiangense TaxID=2678685 RepID=UPI0012ECFB8B|nr:FAD-dependent oxidoreductase [Mesorhizobium xinjiangense]